MTTSSRVALTLAAVIACALPASAQENGNNPYLETIGALAAGQLYTNYMYIGVTGDAFAANAYKAKQVRGMMDEAAGMIDNISRYLTKVRDGNITDEDKKFLTEALAIFGLLKNQATALKRYAGTGDQADADAYEQARQAAWGRLKALLNIK